jgi:tRNA dimethylallyltransferase
MNNSDRNNPRRLIRRIEIAEDGSILPLQRQQETLSARFGNRSGCQNGLKIVYMPFFHPTTDVVRTKIALRVEQRLKDGAIEEVKKLLKKGYTKNDPGLNAIGYQQLISYLNKETSLDEAKKLWITKEVQYAKRQKTYFKKYFPT